MNLRNFLKHTASVGTAGVITKLVGFALVIVLTRYLGPHDFGLYSLAMALGFLAFHFVDMGLNATLIKFSSESYTKKEFGKVRAYILEIFRARVVLGFIVTVMLFLFSEYVCDVFSKPELSLILKYCAVFIFLYSLSSFLLAVCNSFRDFFADVVRSAFYDPLRLFLSLIFLHIGLWIPGVLIGFSMAAFASIVALTVYIIKRYRFLLEEGCSRIDKRKLYLFAFFSALGTLTAVFYIYVDTIMIGLYLPPEELGYYRAAYAIVSGLISVFPLRKIFLVYFSEESKNKEELMKRLKKSFFYGFSVSIPLIAFLFLFSKLIVVLVYGAEYLKSAEVLPVLALLLIRSLDIFGGYLRAVEKPQLVALANVFGVVINVCLNALLIPVYGIFGAAVATVISSYFVFGISGVFVYLHSGNKFREILYN